MIAAPVGYLLMHRWLAQFADRVGLGVEVFVGTGLVAVLIALLTVSYQAWRAARTNPVEALRYE